MSEIEKFRYCRQLYNELLIELYSRPAKMSTKRAEIVRRMVKLGAALKQLETIYGA